MTIEEAEETLRSIEPYKYNVPADKVDEAKKTIIDAVKGGAHIANYFGMTVEAERRVMKNAVRLISMVVDDYVFGCDSGCEAWREFFTGISEELDKVVEEAERPSDFCYTLPSDTWLFKCLISWNTGHGGQGSAMQECAKIGKVLKGDDYD